MNFYEPTPISPPDLELLLPAHLREVSVRLGTLFGREFPSALRGSNNQPLDLPCTIAGTTYTAAVVIRDDGGPWPNRTISIVVLGARNASYSATRALAAWCASQLATLALQRALPIAAVNAVRGPLSVASNPPEFHLTADLTLVGKITT